MSKLTLAKGLLTVSLLTTTASPSPAAGAPDGWEFLSPRAEIAPKSSVDRDSGNAYSLIIEGAGDVSDGRWVKRFALPASQHVTVSARYRASNVEMAARNVIALVSWLDENGKELGGENLITTTTPDADGWRPVTGTYPVPAKAKSAQLELRLRWSPQGRVEWRDASVKAAQAPAPRKVKVATVHHRPRSNPSAQVNLEEFAKHIDAAGAQKADIVCLPEAATLIGRGADYLGSAEPIPGPSTQFLGQVAKRNHTYIVAGLLEKDGKAAYNTAVLIDRQGNLAGKYRKVCLPSSEYNGGLAPGNEYPVFKTDFGTVGIMICWDVAYPEVARELAASGAEIILMPIWGGNETLCRARAIENQVPLVTSSYDLKSAIYDQAGDPLAQVPETSASTVIYSDIDLSRPMNWKWSGTWKNRIWLEGPVRKDPAAPAEPAPQSVSTLK